MMILIVGFSMHSLMNVKSRVQLLLKLPINIQHSHETYTIGINTELSLSFRRNLISQFSTNNVFTCYTENFLKQHPLMDQWWTKEKKHIKKVRLTIFYCNGAMSFLKSMLMGNIKNYTSNLLLLQKKLNQICKKQSSWQKYVKMELSN